tara:strand:+ start:2729 stop:2989 length:261 start_codon:yes stop_codon:yes gene_type:complete
MSRLKFSDASVDKNVAQLTKNVKQRGDRTNVTTGLVSPGDLSNGQFVFTTIKKAQEGPQGPAQDEGRIYFKDNSGDTYVFTGVKVG